MRSLAARLPIAAAVLATAISLPNTGKAAEADGASTSGDASAMRVYRDPTTGQLTGPPPAVRRSAEPDATTDSTSPASPPPLVVEPNPRGGGKARLTDAYEHSTRATKDAAGKTTLDCVRGEAAPKE